jgi:A/G-specific adenine glycosylase
MLQQTQVETVRPYYERWVARFPTVQTLAAAPLPAVLSTWEGLGYYSRARNLHRAAQRVAKDYAGALPRTPAELQTLPGIGRYTAAAIASIAFGVDAAVLDGNVKRVLARVFDIQAEVKSSAGEKRLWALAEQLVPPGRAGDYNQAVMDLGATICTPRAPACPHCPMRGMCAANRLGVQLERPVMPPRPPTPTRLYLAGVVRKGLRVLITQRPADGLLGGMWAFPAVPIAPEAQDTTRGPLQRPSTSGPPPTWLKRGLRDGWGVTVIVGAARSVWRHAFTHFQLVLEVYDCDWHHGRLRPGTGRWVRVDELADYPMGRVDRKIALSLAAANMPAARKRHTP